MGSVHNVRPLAMTQVLRATWNFPFAGAVGKAKTKEAPMAFYDSPHDPRLDDPFRDQRTASLFDGPAFWFLVVLIIVITALALIYPGPGSEVGTDTATINPSLVQPVNPIPSTAPEVAPAQVPGEPRPTQAPIR